MEEHAAAISAHARLHTTQQRNVMMVANIGLLIVSSIILRTVASYEYKNYPIQVHQMFQERVQQSLKSGDRVRGEWGSWAAWSDCSRSCGTGIQSQSRECVPMRGFHLRKRSIASIEGERPEVRPFCIGTYKRYHVCNTQECPNFVDLRAEQCAIYNGKFHKGNSYQWEPFPDAPNECALNCRAIGERFYATLAPTVLDGTPCRGPGIRVGRQRLPGLPAAAQDRWLCVGGQCKSVGCDGVVGSGRVFDACGVCGGEGTGCRLFEGIFLEPKLPMGYQLVTTIPKGAVSLNVSELRNSKNSLALRDSQGKIFLNGPPSHRSSSGAHDGAGTIFSYHRGDALHTENIWAEGSLPEPVDLMILYEELNPGILYKYMLPINEKLDDSAMLAPPLLVTGPHDKIGNEIPEDNSQLMIIPKTMYRKETDIENVKNNFKEEDAEVEVEVEVEESESESNKNSNNQPLNGTQKMAGDQPMESYPSSSSSISQDNNHRPINTKAGRDLKRKKKRNNRKKFYWKISGLSPCSKACGGGLQYATFKCFRESTRAMAPERRCRNVPRPPSPPPLSCNTRPCPPRWRPGPWGPCSVTCGLGTQIRKLECVQELNAKLLMRVSSGACIDKTDLKTISQCKLNPCNISTSRIPPEPRQIEPQLEKLSDESRWTTGLWGACSSTCGEGIRKRRVTCVMSGNTTCSYETKPANETTCEYLPECDGNIIASSELKASWLYTDWSAECSAECGNGFKTRQIACNDGNEVFCEASMKPSFKKICQGNGTECQTRKLFPQWFVGGWSECTVSCGVGILHRDVICVKSYPIDDEIKMTIIDDNECDDSVRPTSEEKCSRPPCPAEWFTSDWSECSKSCGPGFQTRIVRCLREGVPVTSGCSESDEPKGRRLCKKEACKSDSPIPLNKTPKKFNERTECVDKYPNCNAVLKAGLCRINYYKHSCCNCRAL